jgi:hypothetical protein
MVTYTLSNGTIFAEITPERNSKFFVRNHWDLESLLVLVPMFQTLQRMRQSMDVYPNNILLWFQQHFYLGGLVSCFLCNKRQTVVVFSMLNALFDIYRTHVGLEKSTGETPLISTISLLTEWQES